MNAKKIKQIHSIITQIFPLNGRPVSKAREVTAKPSSAEGIWLLVVIILIPVKRQTTKVSMKVPVIVTRPPFTAESVLALAAAIGAEPSPDSLEKIPLLMPILTTSRKVIPVAAPNNEDVSNAEVIINFSDGRKFSILKNIIIREKSR